MFQIRVVCSLIAVVLTTFSQASGYDMLISPCPKVFKYEVQVVNHQPLAKRWYGVVNLATNVTYHALWLNIILDRKADILGSWIGEVTSKDNIDFMIENLNITIQPEQKRTACFFVQYSSDFQPKVTAIFINGREVCHAYNYTDAKADKPISRLNNNGGNNKSRIKSAERTVAVPIIENISNKAHHSKKIIRTTTSKPNYHIQTTTKRTQTTTRKTKHINPVHVTPKSKTKLFFLKKPKNNQQSFVVIIGNSTCFSCKSNVRDESTKINNTVKGPTVTIQQEHNKDKNLQLNIQTFNNLHTVKNANLTTDILTSRKIKGVYRSKTDNNKKSDSLKTSTNAYLTTDASTTRKIIDDSSKIVNNERFESLQTAQTTIITTYISTTTQIKGDNRPTTGNQRIVNLHTTDKANLTTEISTTTKINGDDKLKINNNGRFNDLHTTGNANLTTEISTTMKINGDDKLKINNNGRFNDLHTTGNANLTTEISTTMKINGDDRLKIDNNQRFGNLHITGNENLTTQILTTMKIKDDNRPKTNNNQRFDNLGTTRNVNLTAQISTKTKIKGDDRPKIDNNERFDNLQTGQNVYTTEISTTRKIKDSHILKIPNNRKHNSLQTTPTLFTTVSISTTRKMKSDDRSNLGNNHRFDSLQKGPNVFITTNISTTRQIKGDDRRNRRTNNDSGFDNLQAATNRYIMTDTSSSKKTKVGGGSDDFEVENNEDGLDTLGVIGLPETSVRPEIDTISDTISSSDRQPDIRDIFREPTLDEEEEIHKNGDRAVIPSNFDPEPSCGKVLKTRQLHLPYGSSTSEGQWPWQVAIYQQRSVDLKYICGGTLVSQRHVVTAAHCVTRKRTMSLVHTKTITVYLGKFNLRLSVEGVQIRFVKGIRVHPEYNSTTFSRDLAILELRSAADITDLVRPVCLWPEDEIGLENVVGQTGSVVGWSFEDSSLTNAELHLTEMPVFDHDTCISAFDNFYETLLSDYTYCAGYRQGTDTCNSNDSGGGMVFKKGKSWYLRGIVSVSISLQNEHRCDSKHFIVFTDIAKFIPWIRDYID
ncbi:unnamed protein product [Arctia plantaginis]|uniref:Peptidase S1 domain-containing protein n=1 Tax=Arctia plantaginis TaxID=874455 RepID=A0A8S1AKU6_ARCPL|nr:unnamed protein product [Arctia plantaginis]